MADERYDLVFDMEPAASGACKTAALTATCWYSLLLLSSDRCGMLKRSYTSEEIDAVAAYCDELDSCYLVPIDRVDGLTTIRLRLAPAKNNQARRVNWAKDFEFAATLGPHGAIAQLGERLAGSQKVAGSSPAGSTL